MDKKEKLTREQMEEIVIRETGKKTKLDIIAEMIGMSKRKVSSIRKELEKTGRLETREQIDAIIEEMLKSGVSYEKIAEETGKSIAHISNVKKRLKEQGEITDEQRDEIRQGEKEERLEKDNKIVLEGLLNGETNEEIADRIDKSESWVSNIRKRLVLMGKITEEQIKQAKRARELARLQSGNLSENEKLVVSWVKLGKNKSEMTEKMGNNYRTISSIIERLTEAGIITDKDIESGKRKRRYFFLCHDPLMQEIRELARLGENTLEIEKKVLLDEVQVAKYIKEFIDYGLLTQEEINTAREQEKVKRDKIIELLKQGFSYEEIKGKIETSDEKIQAIERKAINWKKFTKEDLENVRSERRNKSANRRKKTLPEQLKKARRIIDLDIEYSDEEIRTLQKEIIKDLKHKAGKQKVTKEELNTIDKLIYMIDIDVDTIIDNARLHVKALDFEGALKFLNSSKSSLDKKDRDKVEEMCKTVKLTIQRNLAEKLLREKHSVQEVINVTGLSEVEVLAARKRIDKEIPQGPGSR